MNSGEQMQMCSMQIVHADAQTSGICWLLQIYSSANVLQKSANLSVNLRELAFQKREFAGLWICGSASLRERERTTDPV